MLHKCISLKQDRACSFGYKHFILVCFKSKLVQTVQKDIIKALQLRLKTIKFENEDMRFELDPTSYSILLSQTVTQNMFCMVVPSILNQILDFEQNANEQCKMYKFYFLPSGNKAIYKRSLGSAQNQKRLFSATIFSEKQLCNLNSIEI